MLTQTKTDVRNLLKLNVNASDFRQRRISSFTNFELLPAAAVAAGSDKLVLLSGTGTEVVARAPRGGMRITTQATVPADNDQVQLAGVADTNFGLAASAANGFWRVTPTGKQLWLCMCSILNINSLFAAFGLDQNITDVDPSGTAGDGARFLYIDPAAAEAELTVAPGFTAAQRANWILHQKVAGADTYVATKVPVVANQTYLLGIEIGPNKVPLFYIDGQALPSPGLALTTDAQMAVMLGCEVTAGTPAQKSVDVFAIKGERSVA